LQRRANGSAAFAPVWATLAGWKIQSLADKFPAQGNRDFSNVLQERFFDKQGNYRSTAHVDEPAGIDLAGGQDNRHDVSFDVIQRDRGDAG
jgi:hypothetical protein